MQVFLSTAYLEASNSEPRHFGTLELGHFASRVDEVKMPGTSVPGLGIRLWTSPVGTTDMENTDGELLIQYDERYVWE